MELDFDKYKKEQFCLNKECVDYGKKDAGNIRIKAVKINRCIVRVAKAAG
jgi:hypothetical protein